MTKPNGSKFIKIKNASLYLFFTYLDPPRMDHCPTDVLHLNTSYYTDYAILSELSTGLQAFDSEDNKLQVFKTCCLQ